MGVVLRWIGVAILANCRGRGNQPVVHNQLAMLGEERQPPVYIATVCATILPSRTTKVSVPRGTPGIFHAM